MALHSSKSMLKQLISKRQEQELVQSFDSELLLLPEQLEELKSIFLYYCEKKKTGEKDRFITPKSLHRLFQSIDIPSSVIMCEELIAEWSDTGKIGFSEFLCLFSLSYKTSSAENDLRAAFKVLDTDNDGLVEVSRLVNIMQILEPSLTLKEVNDLILNAFPEQSSNFRDFYQDGRIDYTEFGKMMTQ